METLWQRTTVSTGPGSANEQRATPWQPEKVQYTKHKVCNDCQECRGILNALTKLMFCTIKAKVSVTIICVMELKMPWKG
jgi:hypothetical protein